ncbi:MAG: single-stranded DNA-binding protein [Verrucomicrobiota bacterium]
MGASSIAEKVIASARTLSAKVDSLKFAEPTAYVYNPLDYAWAGHEAYLRRSISGPRKTVFLGMNPGPWGMAQTGVPFGEVELARDWIGVSAEISKPEPEHPKRPIVGFDCEKSEVSGRRLWGYFRDKFGTAEAFFSDRWVANYCPIVFMEDSSRNRTPDKLPVSESGPLYAACDAHLREVITLLEAEWVIGVGVFAETRAKAALSGLPIKFGRVLHPSPASPVANRGWAPAAEKQLKALALDGF